MFNINQEIYLKLREISEGEQNNTIKDLMEHLRPCLFSDYEQLQYLLKSKHTITNYIEKLICFSSDVNQECLKQGHYFTPEPQKGGECCNLHSAYSIIFELQTKTSNINIQNNPKEAQSFMNFYWQLSQVRFINKKDITENTFVTLKEFIIILFDALQTKFDNY